MKFSITNREKIFFGVLTLCFLFISNIGNSQSDSIQDSKHELLDLYFAAGPVSFPVFAISQQDFKKIVPTSKLMAGDLMDVDNNNYNNFPLYNTSEGGNYQSVSSIALYAQSGITIKLKNKEFKNIDGPWLKLGLNYFSETTLLNSGVYKTKVSKYDTMYMVGTTPVRRDSVNFRGLTYNYSCENINVEATLLYKFNDKGIFSVFGGPGAMIGLNYNGKATVTSTHYQSATDYLILSPTDKVFYRSEYDQKDVKEEFNANPNFSFGLFIDFGIDLRLGNTFAIIKKTHFFAEVKPMFRANAVKGGGLQQSVVYAGNVGFRYEIK